MRLGRCMLIGLLAAVMATTAAAQEVTEQEVRQVLDSPQVQHQVSVLAKLYDASDFTMLESQLQAFSGLEQEAVRTGLVTYAVESGALDQAKADWLQRQAERTPAYQVVEQGDGYLVTQSAFHYGAKAKSLVRKWQHIQLAAAMVKQAEAGELVLSEWMAGELASQTVRRDIFLEQLPNLSAQAVAKLAAQFTSDSKLLWLPDNAVIAALAAASRDNSVYHLLWRRRSDQFSLAELNRLAELAPATHAIEQLKAATINPSLKRQAYRALITQHPIPVSARDFLAAKLDEVEDGELVAIELARMGYLDWLRQLAEVSRSKVMQNNFRAAMAQQP